MVLLSIFRRGGEDENETKLSYKPKQLVFKRLATLTHVSLSLSDQCGGSKLKTLNSRDLIGTSHAGRVHHKKVRAPIWVLSLVDPILLYGLP